MPAADSETHETMNKPSIAPASTMGMSDQMPRRFQPAAVRPIMTEAKKPEYRANPAIPSCAAMTPTVLSLVEPGVRLQLPVAPRPRPSGFVSISSRPLVRPRRCLDAASAVLPGGWTPISWKGVSALAGGGGVSEDWG